MTSVTRHGTPLALAHPILARDVGRDRGEVDALGLVVYEPDTANFTLSNWVQSNPHHAQILPASGRVFAANTMTCDYFGWWVANPDALLRNLRQVLYGEGDAPQSTSSPCFNWFAP